MQQTWQETQLLTLVPFRALMLGREFLFFYLATAFDLAPTYLQMTLLRVVLSWLASILACTLLRAYVGVVPQETMRTLAPVNLALKAVGTVLVVYAVMVLHSAKEA